MRIEFFHLRHYPVDADDIAFILCASNGSATELLTYDHHLTSLNPFYDFEIRSPAEFLNEAAPRNESRPSPESRKR